jgi:lipoprotein-anchoring transpeptidase ErfK/SrfK
VRISGALVAVLALSLTACQGSGAAEERQLSAAGMPTSGPSRPEVVFSPKNKAKNVRPDQEIVVQVSRGVLRKVTVKPGGGGKKLTGVLAPDGASWTSSQPLEVSKRYSVTVTSAGQDGTESVEHSSFRTVTPSGTVYPNMTPLNGQTVGVGMPVIVNFATSVRKKRRGAVEEALKVTSKPEVVGDWRWMSSTQLMWRPKKYWPQDTSVKISRDLRGVEVAPGYWGTDAPTVKFTTGDAMISTVNIAKHVMTVRRNGKVIRKIPITTGKKGFVTRTGIKVIMTKERKHKMDAETTGISKDDPEYYNVTVDYAMRLTGSGEFIHAAPWSVGSQGHANVSHGCTGMSTAQAKWLFSRSQIGDVVEHVGGTRDLEWGNGYTVWEMSYAKWSSD